ncbi:uncharacterized protein LOC143151797 [Ptiloglossa arizonensis]|uniref:uncharacterized protein LOC143151797 n=1 Tax=Ptiloglossa arizonensis TaxID=3350558 RepID=UPI003FA0E1F7
MGVDLLIPRNRNDDAGAATRVGFESLFPFYGFHHSSGNSHGASRVRYEPRIKRDKGRIVANANRSRADRRATAPIQGSDFLFSNRGTRRGRAKVDEFAITIDPEMGTTAISMRAHAPLMNTADVYGTETRSLETATDFHFTEALIANERQRRSANTNRVCVNLSIADTRRDGILRSSS